MRRLLKTYESSLCSPSLSPVFSTVNGAFGSNNNGFMYMYTERMKINLLLLILFTLPVRVMAEASNSAFFPLKQGDQWVYLTTNKEKKEKFDMQVTVEGPWQDHGKSGMILTQKDKRGKMREFLLTEEAGIFIYKLGLSKTLTPEINTRFQPAVPRVIFPLTPGTKVHWEGRLKVAMVDKPIIFDGTVVGWEDIDVPAGHFHCLKLHYHEKRGEDLIDENAWYAEKVGQVKYDGGKYIKELTTYKID